MNATVSAVDPELHRLLVEDALSQGRTLSMAASAGLATPAVADYYGTDIVTGKIERLAVARALTAFDAGHVSVAPSSGNAANLSVYFGLLRPGDVVVAPDLDCGGDPVHGSATPITSRFVETVRYGLDGTGRIDYKHVRQLAQQHRPRLIVCTAGHRPRTPDFARLRAIADETGAYLLADIAAVAALVVAGVHPNPVAHAHITTAAIAGLSGGTGGGLILLGRQAVAGPAGRTLRRLVDESAAAFSLPTAAPAPTALTLHHAMSPRFRRQARLVTANARRLAGQLLDRGYDVVTYGTDNHLVLVNTMSRGMTGVVAQRALESCGILAGRDRLAFDAKPARVGSGIHLGTLSLTVRGMTGADIARCTDVIDTVLSGVTPRSDTEFSLPEPVRSHARDMVARLCRHFPSRTVGTATIDTVRTEAS